MTDAEWAIRVLRDALRGPVLTAAEEARIQRALDSLTAPAAAEGEGTRCACGDPKSRHILGVCDCLDCPCLRFIAAAPPAQPPPDFESALRNALGELSKVTRERDEARAAGLREGREREREACAQECDALAADARQQEVEPEERAYDYAARRIRARSLASPGTGEGAP